MRRDFVVAARVCAWANQLSQTSESAKANGSGEDGLRKGMLKYASRRRSRGAILDALSREKTRGTPADTVDTQTLLQECVEH